MIEALLGFVAMFALMSLRVPIAFSMAVVGFAGLWWMRSWNAAVASTTTEILDIAKYTLSVVPLFVLMGNFVTRAGMSRELYAAAYSFIGHKRGGLAMSTVMACAGFGAICGSSIATTATMARVSMPEMRRFGYRDSFAAGAIAAEHGFAVHIFYAVNEDFDFVANLQVSFLAGHSEFTQRHAAFGFETHIDDGMVIIDCGYGAFYDAAFKATVCATK